MEPGHFRCRKTYQTPYPDSILFREGEQVDVGEEYDQDPTWNGWIRCRGSENQEAWIPYQYLQIEDSLGVLLLDYDARELTLMVDEIVLVKEVVNGFGVAENQIGEIGWVPMNHLEAI